VSHLGRVVFSLELSEYTSFLLLIVLVLQYNNYHSRPPLGIASRRIGPRTIDGPSGRLYQQGKHLTCSHPSKFAFTSAGRRHPRVWRWHQPTLLRTRSQPTVGMGRAEGRNKLPSLICVLIQHQSEHQLHADWPRTGLLPSGAGPRPTVQTVDVQQGPGVALLSPEVNWGREINILLLSSPVPAFSRKAIAS
jgi:hypothetical protein